MHTENNLPLLQLTHRPDLDILLGRWGYQPSPADLPPVYEKLTDVGLDTGCRFWLQDIRRRTFNDPHITQWLLTTYFPDMAQRLGGRLFVAYLAGPTLFHSIVNQPGYVPAEAYEHKPYAISFFGDEGAAIDWLKQQQRA